MIITIQQLSSKTLNLVVSVLVALYFLSNVKKENGVSSVVAIPRCNAVCKDFMMHL